MIKFDSSSLSIKGEYHDDNQDSILMDPASGIFVVADGLGGAPAGALASKTVTTAFYSKIKDITVLERLQSDKLTEAVQASIKELQKLVLKKKKLQGMGSTLSVLVFDNTSAKIIHVGDSVILRFREDILEQMTAEHTLLNDLIKQGILDSDAADRHPLKHVLSQCISANSTVQPDISEIVLQHRDIYILGSDGLLKLINPNELKKILLVTSEKTAVEIIKQIQITISQREFIDDFTLGIIKIGI
jgi:PPM family protein phosphatase